MLQQTLSQNQSLRQEQILAPQQLQSLELLQAPLQELEQKLAAIAEQNPTLELLRPGTETLVGDPTASDYAMPAAAPDGGEDGGMTTAFRDEDGSAAAPAAEMAGGDNAYGADDTDMPAAKEPPATRLDAFNELCREFLPAEDRTQETHTAEDAERRQFRFDSLTVAPALHDRLLEQLRQTDDLDDHALKIGEEIIGSIDDTGYLRTHPADIAIATGSDMATVERMLRLVQEFDPPGVGARDPRECLLLQLERQGKKGTLEWKAVAKHLDALARNQIPKVAAALGVTPTQVYDLLAALRRLTPYPGTASSSLAPDINTFITPEIHIWQAPDGGWQVESNREYRPRVRVSPAYLDMLRDPETTTEVKSWLRQKLLESRQVMRALQNRENTLERIARSLLKFQPAFFEHGPGFLRPLTLDQVAQDLGLHETTISRAIAGKYLDGPSGVLPFRKFFAGGVVSDAGDKISSQSIKERLAQLIREEDTDKPLADQDLVKLLADQGLKLARRTVAKYREELNLPSSHLRRHFTLAPR